MQGRTGSGRTHSALILMDGMRGSDKSKYIAYLNMGEGNQINFYKREFENIIDESFSSTFDPVILNKRLKKFVEDPMCFGIIIDTFSEVWNRTVHLAEENGGANAVKGSNKSGYHIYKNIYNQILRTGCHEGSAHFFAIFVDAPKSVKSGNGFEDIGYREVAEKSTLVKFDIVLKISVITAKLSRRNNDPEGELMVSDDPVKNKYDRYSDDYMSGFFYIKKSKGPSGKEFPLLKRAPRGLCSDSPLNSGDGEAVAKWLQFFD